MSDVLEIMKVKEYIQNMKIYYYIKYYLRVHVDWHLAPSVQTYCLTEEIKHLYSKLN